MSGILDFVTQFGSEECSNRKAIIGTALLIDVSSYIEIGHLKIATSNGHPIVGIIADTAGQL